MELTLKTDLSIGQKLYYLNAEKKTVYAPCPTCKNERNVSVVIEGETFQISCPKCAGKSTKGDKSKSIVIKQHSVESAQITGFAFGTAEYGKVWRVNVSYYSVDPETLTSRYDVQYYVDLEAAKKAAKDLNKSENLRKKEFLEGLES
jgi:endogenous inhibitor of DNA gyrase (YacG/DUF329 family)